MPHQDPNNNFQGKKIPITVLEKEEFVKPRDGFVVSNFSRIAKQNSERIARLKILEQSALQRREIEFSENYEIKRIFDYYKSSLDTVLAQDKIREYLIYLCNLLDEDLFYERDYVSQNLMPYIKSELQNPATNYNTFFQERMNSYSAHSDKEAVKIFRIHLKNITQKFEEFKNKYGDETSLKKIEKKVKLFVKNSIFFGWKILNNELKKLLEEEKQKNEKKIALRDKNPNLKQQTCHSLPGVSSNSSLKSKNTETGFATRVTSQRSSPEQIKGLVA